MSERFENSPEHEDWIEETGGRDEDYDYYYEKFQERQNREMYSAED